MTEAKRTADPAGHRGVSSVQRPTGAKALIGAAVALGLAGTVALASFVTLVTQGRDAGPIAMNAGAAFSLLIGLTQAVYVVPIYFWTRRTASKKAFRDGFLLGAIAVAVMNIALLALMFLLPWPNLQ